MQKLIKSLVLGAISLLSVVAFGAALSAGAQVVPLSVSCYATPQTAQVGSSITYVASASGGYGNYTYYWTGTNNLSGTGQSVSQYYSYAGQQTATITVSSNGQTATASCSANVGQNYNNGNYNNGNLYVTCSANPYNSYVGQQVTWTAYPTGGNGNYYYLWSGTDSLSASGNNTPVVTTTYNYAGQKNVSLTVISGDQRYQTTCSTNVSGNNYYYNNTYYNQLNAFCYGQPGKANVGDTINWYGSASGGQGGQYYYSWTGDDGFSGTGQDLTYNYSTQGTKNAHMTVISNGQTVNVNCSVVIGPIYPIVYNNTGYTNTYSATPLASGVYLSQVPYTGAGPNLQTTLFLLGLFLWSAFAAHIIIQKSKVRMS